MSCDLIDLIGRHTCSLWEIFNAYCVGLDKGEGKGKGFPNKS
jgi:hypothetical protein